jgi:hypothetical protein
LRRIPALVLPLLVSIPIGCESRAGRDADVDVPDNVATDAGTTSTTSVDVAPSFSTRDGSSVASVLPPGVDVVVSDNSYENPVGDRLRVTVYSDRPSGPPRVIISVNRGSQLKADEQDLADQAANRFSAANVLARGNRVDVKGMSAALYQAPDDPMWTHVLWQENHATVDVAGYRLQPADLVEIAEGLRPREH